MPWWSEFIGARTIERSTDALLTPLQQQQRERDHEKIASTTRRINRLDMEINRIADEMPRGAVSRKDTLVGFRDRLKSEVDELVSESARKQAEPEIVRRNIARTLRWLAAGELPRVRAKRFRYSNNHKDILNKFDQTPRTRFGNEAWIGRHVSNRLVHALHLNGGFLTRSIVIPCIQRRVRKEVIHARGYARAHRGPRRQGRWSDIGC